MVRGSLALLGMTIQEQRPWRVIPSTARDPLTIDVNRVDSELREGVGWHSTPHLTT
jgi:hypothetical protein